MLFMIEFAVYDKKQMSSETVRDPQLGWDQDTFLSQFIIGNDQIQQIPPTPVQPYIYLLDVSILKLG